MKSYEDVIADIGKLKGMQLESINPGSNIEIVDVNFHRESVVLKTSNGKTKSRPLGEIRKIWDEMQVLRAVHVDSVLNGSGSSRNQPETILANLPYIEYLKIDGKKHIAYVERDTHALGTLKKMDDADANSIRKSMKQFDNSSVRSVIVSDDVASAIESLKKICPGTETALERGIYVFKTNSADYIVATSNSVDLKEGTYVVFDSSPAMPCNRLYRKITLHSFEYFLIDEVGIKALVCINKRVSNVAANCDICQNQYSKGHTDGELEQRCI